MSLSYYWKPTTILPTETSRVQIRTWDGRQVPASDYFISGAAVVVSVPSAGRYKLTISEGADQESKRVDIHSSAPAIPTVKEDYFTREQERHSRIDILPITYIYPDYYSETGQWERLNNHSDAISWVMMNPASGPGTSVNPDYDAQMKRVRAQGFRVMGYLSTDYSNRSASIVREEITRYTTLYPFIEGIFLDESVNGWGATDQQLNYYRDLYAWVKSNYPHLIVTTNPGSSTAPAILETADRLMTFENTAATYLTTTDTSPAHYLHLPREKFWHAIYNVTDEAQARQVIEKVKSEHVGHVYLTDRTLAQNPWSALPAEWLWNLQLDAFGPTTKESAQIITSPNGTRYRLTVADDGTLGTSAL